MCATAIHPQTRRIREVSVALDVTRRTTRTTRQLAEATIDLRRIAPTDVARLVEILFTLARHGVLTVARRGPYLVMQPRDRAPRALAVALRHSFAHLGPTFVKLGQLIASSPGLFPDVFSEEFRKLLDRVPAEPTHRVKAIIHKELGKPVDELFASFGDKPIAAASIAQVHEAWLHDGTHVAVKIRRPNLSGRVERDLRLMRYLAGIIERSGTIGELSNPVAIVEDFGIALRSELDFHNEADAALEFEANLRSFGDNDRIVAPMPIAGLVARRVMVMTFIEGISVDDAERLVADDHDLEDLLRLGVRSWMEAALVHGFFHGDVHAGNLFVTPDSKVVYLDFGIMGRLDAQPRAALRAALPAVLVERDYTKAVQAMFSLGATTKPVDIASAAEDVRDLVEPLLDKPLGDISYAEVFSQVLRVATRHHVRLPRELVLVVKQLLYFERYSKELAPDYQILGDRRILRYLLAGGDDPEYPTSTATPAPEPEEDR